MNQRTRKYLFVFISLVALGSLVSGPQVLAKDNLPDIGDYADDGFGMDLSAYFLCNFGYHKVGVGAGALFAYPVFPSGFIQDPEYRDALHVEGGLDFYRWGWTVESQSVSLMAFAPQIGLRYAVYLSEVIAPFVSVKIGASFAMADGVDDKTRFFWSTSAGLLWDFVDFASLRAEFGWGYYRDILRVGVLFRL